VFCYLIEATMYCFVLERNLIRQRFVEYRLCTITNNSKDNNNNKDNKDNNNNKFM
jgi:hypothetical protein